MELKHKRLIFFLGLYDILDIFSYELIRYCENADYEVLVIDNRNFSEGMTALSSFITKPVTAMITFNNLGTNTELVKGENLWECLGIPCINILMDHPYAHDKALSMAPSNSVVLCVDRNHVDYLGRFFPHISMRGFLPHGGNHQDNKLKKIKDRSISLLYMGSLSRKFADSDKPDFSAFPEIDLEKIANAVFERMISAPEYTMEYVIEKTLSDERIVLPDDKLRTVIRALHYIDMYASSYYREKLVRTLAVNGLPITIYGKGWDICDWRGLENVNYRGTVSAYDAVRIMGDSKIVLNSMPWFRDGSHDRVFNGMLSGAYVMSKESKYLREVISEDAAKLFSLSEIDELPEILPELLTTPDAMQRTADCGYELAVKAHTWDCRAKELDRDLLEIL